MTRSFTLTYYYSPQHPFFNFMEVSLLTSHMWCDYPKLHCSWNLQVHTSCDPSLSQPLESSHFQYTSSACAENLYVSHLLADSWPPSFTTQHGPMACHIAVIPHRVNFPPWFCFFICHKALILDQYYNAISASKSIHQLQPSPSVLSIGHFVWMWLAFLLRCTANMLSPPTF